MKISKKDNPMPFVVVGGVIHLKFCDDVPPSFERSDTHPTLNTARIFTGKAFKLCGKCKPWN